MTLPSAYDNENMILAREFIDSVRQFYIAHYVKETDRILDIGNQGKELPAMRGAQVITADLTEENNPDVVADITVLNTNLSYEEFDGVMCTEVLEHVVDPFSAVSEIKRILKVGGVAIVTTPLNARIHGPIPDCWRFTEFGLRLLFRDFEILHFRKLDTPERTLFPLHYGIIVRKITDKSSDPRKMKFEPID